MYYRKTLFTWNSAFISPTKHCRGKQHGNKNMYATSQQIPHNRHTGGAHKTTLVYYLPSTSSSLTSMYLYSKLQPLSFIPFGLCNFVLEISHNLSISVVFPEVMLPVIQILNKHNTCHFFVLPNTKRVLENDGPTLAELAATSLRMVDLVKSKHRRVTHYKCRNLEAYLII